MGRPSIFVRLSERRHRKRSASFHGNHDLKQATTLAPALTHGPHEKSWIHRPIDSISSVIHRDHQPAVLDPYEKSLELIREKEYPHMRNGTYLDHSGTTIYAASTISRFSNKMLTNLYGNPHSTNAPAKLSGDMVDSIRLKALRFLGADPSHFDLIFTANATAAIKLVADSFRDLAEQARSGSFWYGYHRDSHTSLVGVRELTANGEHYCFANDLEVESWLAADQDTGSRRFKKNSSLGLFAYPGQSNLTGRRLPLSWPGRVRGERKLQGTYTLFDAAALAMTSDMSRVFSDPSAAPDFVCLSFYKIFGFPDLGGLVVRKDSGHILALRKYFGGGTVSLVSTIGAAWHISKALEQTTSNGTTGEHATGGLHEGLEDGTLPFHSIIALGEAIDVHCDLYGSMGNISKHTTALVRRLYDGMKGMRYGNAHPVFRIYEDEEDGYGDATRQGATVAFNVQKPDGAFVSYSHVESLANENGFYIRSGGVCNPGGVFTALQYEPWQLNRARSAGHHCGPQGLGVINELPTGVVRASLGAMSTVQEVDRFLSFLREAFVVGHDSVAARSSSSTTGSGGVFSRVDSATTDMSDGAVLSAAA
ncbi:putative molybdenum cofactor sulfurase [Podospora australis]|uniref:Molybdenum cofactor sulfurase n=1 Tax=Podospora australis TaxID=1536484 RepID=A0AAN6WTG8_9PEZI|nr:putative molybdenum cofactor sulfurase [Podospora australis]